MVVDVCAIDEHGDSIDANSQVTPFAGESQEALSATRLDQSLVDHCRTSGFSSTILSGGS